ncbi:MAG: hypothetical protein LUF35_03455 [Lachnospiraceae bacterium]|nr:hypothetical protein [Lachnospiraceae bacterium]
MSIKTKRTTLDDDLENIYEEAKRNNGLPGQIYTEPQLWDEIFKKLVFEAPFLLLPIISETFGRSYPINTSVIPLGTEYSVERTVTKDISRGYTPFRRSCGRRLFEQSEPKGYSGSAAEGYDTCVLQ